MKAQGFTLMELAVVLAIIAILAAVMTPVVINYVDQARLVRATGDVKAIADAIRLYQRDAGKYPIYANAASASADTPVSTLLISTGNGPTGGHASWTAGVLASTNDFLGFINVNKLGLSTTGPVGRVTFRGPYIGNVDTDPWGNRYIVTAAYLARSSSNWAFVISAGPDGELDTNLSQANNTAFSASDDDITAVIK